MAVTIESWQICCVRLNSVLLQRMRFFGAARHLLNPRHACAGELYTVVCVCVHVRHSFKNNSQFYDHFSATVLYRSVGGFTPPARMRG